jgi:hypothetical protein
MPAVVVEREAPAHGVSQRVTDPADLECLLDILQEIRQILCPVAGLGILLQALPATQILFRSMDMVLEDILMGRLILTYNRARVQEPPESSI